MIRSINFDPKRWPNCGDKSTKGDTTLAPESTLPALGIMEHCVDILD